MKLNTSPRELSSTKKLQINSEHASTSILGMILNNVGRCLLLITRMKVLLQQWRGKCFTIHNSSLRPASLKVETEEMFGRINLSELGPTTIAHLSHKLSSVTVLYTSFERVWGKQENVAQYPPYVEIKLRVASINVWSDKVKQKQNVLRETQIGAHKGLGK